MVFTDNVSAGVVVPDGNATLKLRVSNLDIVTITQSTFVPIDALLSDLATRLGNFGVTPATHASRHAVAGADPLFGLNAPGSFTLPTGAFYVQAVRLALTGTQRFTGQGTSHLRIT